MRALLTASALLLISTGCGDKDDTGAAVVDGDGDGIMTDVDCDDGDPEVGAGSLWYTDVDGDGYGDSDSGALACEQPSGTTEIGGDCDDGDAAVNPAATEVCDDADLDEDCDGLVDDADAVDASTLLAFYTDGDGDGYGAIGAEVSLACDPIDGLADNATDCDDEDAAVNPGATEVCDEANIDEDCSGFADDDDPGVDASTMPTWYQDADLDGYGNLHGETVASCEDPTDIYGAWVAEGLDCDDGDASINPDGQELCDEGDVDEDCDGLADDADDSVDLDASAVLWYPDADMDGYGDADDAGTLYCDDPSDATDWWTLDATDCDDGDLSVSPAEAEICNDGVDNDCSGDAAGCGLSGEIEDSYGDLLLSGASGEYFGYAHSVADLDGDGFQDLVVCAYQEENPAGSSSAGALYWAYGPFTGDMDLSSAADAVMFGGASYDYFGKAVDADGDADGDGLADVLVGAYSADDYASGSGTVYLFPGSVSLSASGLAADEATLALYGVNSSDYLGEALSYVGDQNGDGVDDFLVGASGEDTGGSGAGAVYLVYGSLALVGEYPIEMVYGAKFTGSSSYDYVGDERQLASAGDVDGDGTDDLLLGARSADAGGSYAGAVYLFLSDASAPRSGEFSVTTADATWTGAVGSDYLGEGLAGAGDVDGDGYDDVLIGADGYDGSGGSYYSCGGAFLVMGGPGIGAGTASVDTVASTIIEGGADYDYLGEGVALGDVDDNGYADVLVGAYGENVIDSSGSSVSDGGATYLFMGPVSAGVVSAKDADGSIIGTATYGYQGHSPGVGDLNSDGVNDVLSSTYGEGTLTVVFGGTL